MAIAIKHPPKYADVQLAEDLSRIYGYGAATADRIYSILAPMTEDIYEYRYEQRDDEYALRCWHDGTQRFYREFTYNMPGWLKNILVTARVAGVIPKIKEPPPDIILWFRTDKDHNLIEFVEMK